MSSNSILPPTSYIKKGKHQKVIGPLCPFTNDPTWPPSRLPKSHYITTTIAEHLISQLSHYGVCANQNQLIRIIQILSEKTNNALSKISQLSCAFKKFEQKTEKQIHTQTNLHPQTHSIWEPAVPLLIPSVAQWGYETQNSGSFLRYNSLKYSQVDRYFPK